MENNISGAEMAIRFFSLIFFFFYSQSTSRHRDLQCPGYTHRRWTCLDEVRSFSLFKKLHFFLKLLLPTNFLVQPPLRISLEVSPSLLPPRCAPHPHPRALLLLELCQTRLGMCLPPVDRVLLGVRDRPLPVSLFTLIHSLALVVPNHCLLN